MENKKQIVTLTDIKECFQRENRQTIIVCVCFFTLFGWLSFVIQEAAEKTIMATWCLLFLCGIVYAICCIIRIQKNTHFHIRTDILINKNIQAHLLRKNGATYKLCFCKGYYEMYMNSTSGFNGVWYDIYDMGSKTVYDTAFIGDSFTLVCVGKRIVLAFNNNYFDVQNNL